MRFTLSGLLILAFSLSYGQTCSIDADSIVCEDDLLAFSATASSGANSYSWDFGDGGTSNNQNISHAYSSFGQKIVTLTVGFSGGGTCIVKDTIMVHDLPEPSFSLAGSEYCYSVHEICLTDASTMGNTTSGYDQRIILWGDGGNSTSSSPSIGDKICYDNYSNPDTFELVVEITNDKGCEAIWREDIVIEHEHHPSFTPQIGAAGCDYQTVCLRNDSTEPDDLKSFIWQFGDGSVDSTTWNRPCHEFAESKKYTATLTVELENGCILTGQDDFTTAFQEVLPDPRVDDSTLCFPEEFVCRNAPIFFAGYDWYLIDVNGDTVDHAPGSVATLDPPLPGTYFVAARIELGDCDTSSPWIQVESYGIKPDFKILNQDQCNRLDTAYFINLSYEHPSADAEYLWVFYDTLSPSCSYFCSTCVNNCYFDTSTLISKHLYEVPDCYFPTLIATDRTHGCIDSLVDTVSRMHQDYIMFDASPSRPCIGGNDYMVPFSSNLCGGGGVLFNPDTACFGPDYFIEFEDWWWVYTQLCDSNNWVSPAFIVIQGDSQVYRSADSLDFYIDYDQICVDTLYYPQMFQLFYESSVLPYLTKNECLPISAKWHFNGDDSAIARIRYQWNDPDTIYEINQYRDTFPDISHLYTEPGAYPVFIWIEDTNHCFVSVGMEFPPLIISAGYFNTFNVDSVICPGDEFVAEDSVLYWFDGFHYWRDTFVEEIYWDFGDGNGFVRDTALPRYSYADRGTYTIQMATVDRNGCTDTARKEIIVGGVNAGIKTSDTEFLCDQIVQFFDSSWSNLSGADDTITSYYWDFGDGTNISKLKNPFHFYDQNGFFTLTHAVSNNEGCSDTIRIQIYMRGPQPYFDIISDTVGCAPFEASMEISGINVSEFILHLNDPNLNTISASSDTIINFTYNTPGVYDIFLRGSDSFYNQTSMNFYTCTEWFPDTTQDQWARRQVVVLDQPPADIDYDLPICPGVEVTFTSISDTIYKEFVWEIDTSVFDPGNSSINYTFEDTGTYLVRLLPYYDPPAPYFVACYDTVEQMVTVSHVKAGFSYAQIDNCSGFQFNDSSVNASSHTWDFGHPISGDENNSTEVNPMHSYSPDTGTFRVCLVVSNDDGCTDEYCEDISSVYRTYADFYNVFTPGIDGKNDRFAPQVDGEDIYDLKIYNRWGELVFSTDSKLIQWDGTDQISGIELPAGTTIIF